MKCSFCGQEIPRGTGKMLVKNDGKIWYFCSRKCEKNIIKLGRKPRETGWTSEFAKAKEQSKGAKQ